MIFLRERFSSIVDEIVPLVELHYKEIAWKQDQIPLNIGFDTYFQHEAADTLQCFTARKGGKIVGYALFWVSPHPHYMSTKFAINDIVFLLPQLRNSGEGGGLVDFCEQELKALGANVIIWHIKPKLDWSAMLVKRGYEHGDHLWQKWLGQDQE